MTALPHLPPLEADDPQRFETVLALTLQVVATLEFAPVLGRDQPAPLTLIAFARQVEQQAQDLARLAGFPDLDVRGAGEDWYLRLVSVHNRPLQIAYHALHTAAYLGVDGGGMTATLMAAVGHALRALADREDFLAS